MTKTDLRPPGHSLPLRRLDRGGAVGWAVGCVALVVIVAAGAGIFYLVTKKTVDVIKKAVEKTPLPQSQLAYTGDWQGQDGATIAIRGDGGGSYHSGGSTIEGGQVTIDEPARTLTIGLGPIKKSFTIEEPPHNSGENSEMKLNGLVFRRTGGFTPSTPAKTEAPPDRSSQKGTAEQSPKEQSPIQALRSLILDTLLNLDQAVQSGDFTVFFHRISKVWQGQTSPDKLRQAFDELVRKKTRFDGIRNVNPVIEPKPVITPQGVLEVSGYYPTQPNRVTFRLKYIFENNDWKLVEVLVRVGPMS